MKPLKEKISITVDNDILIKAREAAEADDRSLSQFINIAIKEYLKRLEEKKWARTAVRAHNLIFLIPHQKPHRTPCRRRNIRCTAKATQQHFNNYAQLSPPASLRPLAEISPPWMPCAYNILIIIPPCRGACLQRDTLYYDQSTIVNVYRKFLRIFSLIFYI